MIVFENDGEIDPRLAMLIGTNVKEGASPIGFFGTGLKYAIACLCRWGDEVTLQSGLAEYRFAAEEVEIRGKRFGLISMVGRHDRAQLGFTTELGRNWEPWMVYRELWFNAHDEPNPSVYEADRVPAPRVGTTRVVARGDAIDGAHRSRAEFILEGRPPRLVVDGLEVHDGPGLWVFYRGIAVQQLQKPSLYTYNVTAELYLTEDRTAPSWSTDPCIARGFAALDDEGTIEATLLADPAATIEPRLDYDYATSPSDAWLHTAQHLVITRPLDVPPSVRRKFSAPVQTCPTCGRPR